MDERLGQVIPPDLVFTNENGETLPLASYLDGEKPVLLTLVYHNCPMLCNLVLHGLATAMRDMNWTPGNEFEVIAVSFNPEETWEVAKREKERYIKMLDRPEAANGWHFLTGTEASIAGLTESLGFRYKWLEDRQEFAHPSALMFLDGNGRVSRYLYGVQYKPRDVRAALVEASEGRVGTAMDQVILYCFQYDPNANSYVLHAVNLMKLGGLLTLLLLGTILFVFWRRETRRPQLRPTT
jgi:protein SCO1/2